MAPEHEPELGGGNALEAVYPNRSPASVYAAVVRTATQLGFGITSRDDAAMVLSFRASGPTRSWPGQEMTAAIHLQGDAVRVEVRGKGVSGYRPVMSDWHLAKALGLMFLDRLTSALSTTPEPEHAAPRAPSRVDQLKTLADLRDRGLLTEPEFATAKKHLLS